MELRFFTHPSRWLVLGLVLPVLSFPATTSDLEVSNATYLEERADSFYLRILPLGGSITVGWGSSTGNGYRKPLRDQLRKDGWNVNMVGTKTGGSNAPITGPAMKDNSVEAVAGYTVAQVEGLLQNSLKYQPNVVLVNAGVNDCTFNEDINNIGSRMSALLDTVFNNIADTTVILSTLIPSLDSSVASCHDSVNAQYRSLVTTRSEQGQKIALAEMAPSTSYWNADDYFDNTHPDDSGHAKMAAIWYKAFSTVYSSQWITAPAVTAAVDDTASSNTCAKEYGNSESTKTQTQSGSGWDDGIYIHHGDPQGERFFSGDYPGEQQYFYFASITQAHSLRDDLIQLTKETSGSSRKYHLYRNTGPGQWNAAAEDFWIPDTCIARGVRWADMNGDGLDDFVCIAPNGDAVPSFNRGDLNFENLGIAKPNEGPTQKYIRLGDIDGDGRCDYCALNDDGSMRCWRNGGLKDISDNWQDMGVVFNARDFGDIDGVRLVDINGDGRADYLWVDDDGQTWTYTNNRGCIKGDLGQGLTPTWRAAENKEYGAGPTMIGIGYPNVRNEIAFGKAYGFVQSFDFLPSRDFIYIEETAYTGTLAAPAKFGNLTITSNTTNTVINGNSTTTAQFRNSTITSNSTDTIVDSNSTVACTGSKPCYKKEKRADIFTYEYSIKVWKNTGTGGGKLKGDGDRYCNMMGRANGRQDYVWVWSNGKMWIWEALDSFPSEPKYWGNDYLMWDITASRSMDRRYLTLVDWDGDGACDIVYASPEGGIVEVWINQIKTTGTLTFNYIGNAAGGVSCDQTPGVGQFDVAVRFADLTGNGRPDYLCIEKDGRTKGYLHNTDGSFTYQPQIKQSDGYDRANFRHADVDGDGLADLIWTDKFRGDAMVWKNMGPIAAAGTGSSFTWVNQGFLYNAPAQGTCLQFPDLDGNGRADMVYIEALENTATTWFNNCPDGSGDDSDTLTSADLPAAPGDATATPELRGLYSFGDSYAAGIGAGTEIGPTKCRRGSRSYSGQLYTWLKYHSSPYMNYNTVACSGDTVDGVQKQINDWNDPASYDALTLSVGGNDVQFAKLVNYCVLTWAGAYGGDYKSSCEQAKANARAMIADTSENGLGHKFKETYKSVMNKAQSDAHLYITSYFTFFNEVANPGDEWCDDVTFYYWNPHHDSPDAHDNSRVYLTLDTRIDLNALVRELNDLISNSVSQANSELGSNRIHYVDVTSRLNNHRWCEWHVEEPNEDRADTQLFLSGWKDPWPGASTVDDNSADLAELESAGQIPIPNADTCEGDLGANPDLYDIFLCDLAQDIQQDPSGVAAVHVNNANAALASGDYGSADIPWLMPTSTAKTFHPRSWGHASMRSAVLTAMREQGQYYLSVPDTTDVLDV